MTIKLTTGARIWAACVGVHHFPPQRAERWYLALKKTAKAAQWMALCIGLWGNWQMASAQLLSHFSQVDRGQAPVVVSGTVPDEATRQALLSRAREIYGAERVVDQLGVGEVTAPNNWSQYVQQMLMASALQQVSKGQLTVRGNNIDLTGEVPSAAHRLQVAADISTVLNPTYVLRNALSVASVDQSLLDVALANRTIEFEPGSANLRPQGQAVLDEMARAMRQLGGKRFNVIGHTDASGDRATNILLSQARADMVRNYLISAGVAASAIVTNGVGPDQPVASNATPEGRARNRRIEFRLNTLDQR